MNEESKNSTHSRSDNDPFFSILIPVYNASAYIGECLENIMSQNFQDWEIVIVDDCSTDDSVRIAEDFSKSDPRIRIFLSETNSGGPLAPRMRAAKLARGEFLVPIDADDTVSEDLLFILHECIQSQNTDLVIPEMWRAEGNKSTRILPLQHIDVSRTWSGKDLVEHTLCQWAIPMAGFSIRRDIYIEADRRLTKEDRKSNFADELLSRWILFLSPEVYLCNARYYYRQNNESVTKANVPRLIDGTLKNCDSLISMTNDTYGEYSHTHLLAIENKFRAAIGLLRLINRSDLDRNQAKKCVRRISEAMNGFDLSILKGQTSPRYLALMKLPMPIARIALKILDPIIHLKDGIRKLL